MKLVSRSLSLLLMAGVVWIAAGMPLMAQDRSTTTITPGEPIVTTQVERAEVVYVSGNELVVKMDNGEIRELTVPDTARAMVDGKEVTVHDLKPGMKLQRTITTTQTPKKVTTVRTVSGTVFAINAPNTLILRFPDGSPNKQYKIPKDQVFIVDGVKKTAFEVRPGTPITATVVTTSEEVGTSEQRVTTGTAPAPPPVAARPATPPPQPILLIESPAPAPVPIAAAAPAPPPRPAPAPAPEPAPTRLPKTASAVPLVGLAGIFLCVTSLAFRTRQKQR
jgi:hypothetical protein